jgi:hypothetical protein
VEVIHNFPNHWHRSVWLVIIFVRRIFAKIYVIDIAGEKVARHPMNENLTHKKALALICGLAISVSVARTAEAVEPEKQPIYSNTTGGLLCGSASTSQCKVPAGQRLIIESEINRAADRLVEISLARAAILIGERLQRFSDEALDHHLEARGIDP